VPDLWGHRLWLRPYRPADRRAFATLVADPRVMARVGGVVEAAHGASVFERCLGGPGKGADARMDAWAVTAPGGRYLGHAALREDETGDRELGYLLHRCCWGRGLATEAARLVLAYGRRRPRGLIYATVDPDHWASRRVLEKCGFEVARWRRDAEGLYPVYVAGVYVAGGYLAGGEAD
jgi:ribosomal-protein-alanine N-acetyltransferase